MAREGPRKPPAPSSLRNIAKMEHQRFRGTFVRFSDNFRPEKRKHRTSQGQTSEVLPRKYGGLGTRSPMFLAHSRASFPPFSTLRRGAARQKRCRNPGALPHPAPKICHTRLAEHTNPPRFPRWKGHCTLSGFLKVFTPFPLRIHARPPRVCFPVSPSIQHPLCPPACVQGVAWAQKYTVWTLSTRALHTVRTYYAP